MRAINRPIQVHRMSQLDFIQRKNISLDLLRAKSNHSQSRELFPRSTQRVHKDCNLRKGKGRPALKFQHPSSHANNAKLSRPLSGTGVAVFNLLHSLLEFKKNNRDNFMINLQYILIGVILTYFILSVLF